MIARNPENHDDMWLVAKDYFDSNFAEIEESELVSDEPTPQKTYNELVGGFKARVVEEQKELDEKVTKLAAFIDTVTFRALTRPEKDDLKTQLKYMTKYLAVINRRVTRL